MILVVSSGAGQIAADKEVGGGTNDETNTGQPSPSIEHLLSVYLSVILYIYLSIYPSRYKPVGLNIFVTIDLAIDL